MADQNTVSDTSLPVDSPCLVLGYGGEGKSTLIERIIYDNREVYKYVLCFCPSRQYDERQYKSVGGLATADCSMDNIKWFFNNQQKLAKLYNKGELLEPPHALFIFDDIMASDVNFYGKDKHFWTGILSVCKHAYITPIFSIQTLNHAISPGMVSQMKKLFIFNSGVDPILIKKCLPPMEVNGRAMGPAEFKLLMAKTFKEKHVALLYDKDNRIYNKRVKVKPAPPDHKRIYRIKKDDDDGVFW